MDLQLWLQLGLAGGMVVTLFVLLSRGKLHTDSAQRQLIEVYQARIADRDKEIDRLREENQRLDQRADILAKQIGQVLEVSRANGLLDALPPPVSERIVQ